MKLNNPFDTEPTLSLFISVLGSLMILIFGAIWAAINIPLLFIPLFALFCFGRLGLYVFSGR